MLPPVHFDVDVAKLNRNQAAGSGGRALVGKILTAKL